MYLLILVGHPALGNISNHRGERDVSAVRRKRKQAVAPDQILRRKRFLRAFLDFQEKFFTLRETWPIRITIARQNSIDGLRRDNNPRPARFLRISESCSGRICREKNFFPVLTNGVVDYRRRMVCYWGQPLRADIEGINLRDFSRILPDKRDSLAIFEPVHILDRISIRRRGHCQQNFWPRRTERICRMEEK